MGSIRTSLPGPKRNEANEKKDKGTEGEGRNAFIGFYMYYVFGGQFFGFTFKRLYNLQPGGKRLTTLLVLRIRLQAALQQACFP
jgi:hypothetical protein